MSFSTKSTADISRIINHRRITAATTNLPPTHSPDINGIESPHYHQNHSAVFTDLAADQAPSPQSYPCLVRSTSANSGVISGVISHVLPAQLISHYHSSKSVELSLDNQKHPTTSGVHQLCSRHDNGPHCQQSAPDVHTPVTMVTALTAGMSMKKTGETVREGTLLSDSEEQEDEDDDEEEEDEIVTAAQLQNMKSRKVSEGYRDSVSSWVKKEDELTPTVEQLHSKGRDTTSELMSKVSNSNSNGQKPQSSKNRRSSLGSTIDEEQETFFERASSLSRLDKGSELLVHHNEAYEHYDFNIWRGRQPSGSTTNGNHSQPSSIHHYDIIKTGQPQSLHDYDGKKEAATQPQSSPYLEIKEGNYSLLETSEMKDQEDSENALDYDYVKCKLLTKLVYNLEKVTGLLSLKVVPSYYLSSLVSRPLSPYIAELT